MYPFRLQEQCYITALHNNLCFLGSSSTFCLYKLLPWKAVLIKITESIYELWMSLSFPFFNPLILVWKCCVTNASLYIAYGFSVALSTGNRSCSWVRYRCSAISVPGDPYTSLRSSPTAHSWEGIVLHCPWESAFSLFGEMLDKDNLVLTSALLLIATSHLLLYYPSSIWVFSLFKPCPPKWLKDFFFYYTFLCHPT